MSSYDSTNDTKLHIMRVRELLHEACVLLLTRAHFHDESKLQNPEKSAFDRLTPQLRQLTYGSEEYEASRRELGEALAHHYANNRHHPEHFQNGINGMDLVDLIEMMADWKAATERHEDGNLSKSIEINSKRFGISDQMREVLTNTARNMEWL